MRKCKYNLLQPDGCAIFYKRDLFNLIESHKIEFEQPGIEVCEIISFARFVTHNSMSTSLSHRHVAPRSRKCCDCMQITTEIRSFMSIPCSDNTFALQPKKTRY